MKANISGIEGPISKRKDEYLTRPSQIETLQKFIDSAKELIKTSRDLATSQSAKLDNEDDLDDDPATPSPPLFQFDEKSLLTLETSVSEVERWLTEKIAAQGKLNLWEDPILRSTDLERKGNQLQNALRKILLEQQTKAKSKSKNMTSTSTRTSPSVSSSPGTSSEGIVEMPVYSEVQNEEMTTHADIPTETSTILDTEKEKHGEFIHEEL